MRDLAPLLVVVFVVGCGGNIGPPAVHTGDAAAETSPDGADAHATADAGTDVNGDTASDADTDASPICYCTGAGGGTGQWVCDGVGATDEKSCLHCGTHCDGDR